MRRILIVGALALVGLSLQTGSAWAKGPVQICGANACARLGSEADSAVGFWSQNGRPRVSPAAPGPFFSIRFAEMPGSPLAYWIPNANVLRVGYERALWVRPSIAEAQTLHSLTKGLQPKSPPRSVTVGVNVEPVEGDLSYLRLYTIGTVTQNAANSGGWLKLLIFGTPTPWTDGRNFIWISRRGSFLRRDGQIVAIPDAIATRVRARLPLTGV
jgi:hypothetical protein